MIKMHTGRHNQMMNLAVSDGIFCPGASGGRKAPYRPSVSDTVQMNCLASISNELSSCTGALLLAIVHSHQGQDDSGRWSLVAPLAPHTCVRHQCLSLAQVTVDKSMLHTGAGGTAAALPTIPCGPHPYPKCGTLCGTCSATGSGQRWHLCQS